MFMNRWLTRKEIVEVNGLTKEEEALVFARVAPIGGSLGRYLEETVDRAIGAVRGGVRPLVADGVSVSATERRSEVNLVDAWAASVATDEKPSVVSPVSPLLVSEKEAAKILAVSRRTVFDLEKRGVLKSVRIGALKRYAVATLKEFTERGGV